MIKIQSVVIQHFRGIQKLALDLGRQNFAIYGPNGTGKSGVVDAIEFAITGTISRLTGQGTSDISLKAHAPHVDWRDRPDVARVVLTAFIPSLNRMVTIDRRVNAPTVPTITPEDDDVLRVVSDLAQHPEFALTRREIIKYVLAPPGERSKEVQALLRLERVEKVRQSLQTILNSCNSDGKRIDQAVVRAQENLVRALGIPVLSKKQIIDAVNQRRQILMLEPLTDLGPDTSLKIGLGAGQEEHAARPKVPKRQAASDTSRLADLLLQEEPSQIRESREALLAIFQQLRGSPSLLRNLKQQNFLRTGFELIEGDQCPFCDQGWDMEALQALVGRKLEQAEQATKLRASLEQAAEPVFTAMGGLRDLLTLAGSYARQLPEPVEADELQDYATELHNRQLRLTDINRVDAATAEVSADYRQTPELVVTTLAKIQAGITALPDPSKEDEAKEYLTVCQERLAAYREAKRQQERSKQQTQIAKAALDAYSKSSTSVLTKIYKDVEEDFTRYYCFVHREDEAKFEGKLTPSLGKLGFDVDFYGRGYFPPGAYHSEGHQDAMGICLYLALMKHTLGKNFTFAVLDDVLMSVDTGHRREICGLLKSEFADTQFVVTTHDQIWLQHMRTEQLITRKSSVEFRRWTVEDGPAVWDSTEVWADIEEDLNNDNVPEAAFTLRRYLESVSNTLSHRFRANVEFRGDAQYDLGELLPAAVVAWKSLLAKAQVSAQSWGKKEETAQLSKRQQEFSRRLQQSNLEQWAINRNVHYNEWTNFRKDDFLPVVAAYKDLLECFQCEECKGFLYVTPMKGSAEGLRCDCGTVNINLKKRT